MRRPGAAAGRRVGSGGGGAGGEEEETGPELGGEARRGEALRPARRSCAAGMAVRAERGSGRGGGWGSRGCGCTRAAGRREGSLFRSEGPQGLTRRRGFLLPDGREGAAALFVPLVSCSGPHSASGQP